MLGDISNEIALHELNDAIEQILKGQLQGRTVINLDL
jgi:D-arabinose 1-dehydrogenase-like Zn-dependent alcohol dehydrogenase